MYDMRKYIKLVENSSVVDSSFIDDMVMSIHPKEEDFSEGDLLHRIDKFNTYRLQELPIDKLYLDEFDIDEDYVEEIADRIRNGENLKPIVYDPDDESIIDGNHRANAYHLLGRESILAYVGDSINPDWNDDYLEESIENNKSIKHEIQDLIDVSEWMNTVVDKLELTIVWEPIEKFIDPIRDMYNSYDEFPEDAKRTKKILKLLKSGAKPLPMYVEKGDPDKFVMEGRHRMVAFFLHGMKTVPVCYVSVKDNQHNLEEAIVKVPKHWVDLIAGKYMPIVKYVYIQIFGQDEKEKEEMANELWYFGSTVDRDHDIYSNPSKLKVIVPNLTLKDAFNVTYIDKDINVVLVATYDLETFSKGSFAPNTKNGNLLIINVAAPIAYGAGKSQSYKDEVKDIEAALKEVIEHELVHLIQHEFGDNRQLKKNSKYHQNREEYLKSPVEFNAQITSFIREFEAKLDRLSQDKKTLLGYQNLLNVVHKSLGDVGRKYIESGNRYNDRKAEAIFLNLVMPNDFMITLRDKKPKQWKRAVKSIVKHLEKKIKEYVDE